ncbi:uncharacterized protein LOC128995103 isoform X4 [Macrosteles quadrilineatus]|nr:uncharacterized protein LOC128995103 isoform X4 [Macrosteles quadrilineatus]
MNNCLADLSRLIPADYMKKGRGRIEKTEIIEMAIKHMKHLQDHHSTCHLGNCEIEHNPSMESEESYSPPESNTRVAKQHMTAAVLPTHENVRLLEVNGSAQITEEHYRLGYHECLSETMHFLVEVEGMFAGDKLCVQLISHLQRHCDKILKGGGLNNPRVHPETSSSSKERSSGSGSGSSSDGGERQTTDNFYNSASQLRDILTSNSLPQNRREMVPEPPSPPNSVNGTSLPHDNHSSSGSLYKFKNNIKQRFSAEHSGSVEQSHPISLKRRRSDDWRRPSDTSSIPSPPPVRYPPTSPASPPPARSSTPGVPIFALHSKGSFYIPLTIDHHVLAPFLAELGNVETNLANIVLHPVTISVNFQQTISRQMKHPQGCYPPDWSSTPSSYLPLSKWAVCAPDRN